MKQVSELSKLGQKALQELSQGAKFREALEKSYTGGQMFKVRLVKSGKPVRGFGFSTFSELREAGLIQIASGGTSVSTYWEKVPS